ncbi:MULTISPECIES: restriction endonuclease subunit S [Prevotellaceae]|uniref:restriction endonuclease subunit S n=1 Tax=Prevotellaceae TaxID=171552 RepID=UPI001314954A|nr:MULTISPECIES: restriction endonuclease subunit S [Prevotellaceae]
MVEMKSGYKMTEVGVIPEDWEVKNVSESCLIKARIGWQGLKKSEYMSSGDYLLITGTDFDNGQVNWKSCAYVSKARYEQDSNIKIRPQDILISKDGTIGKVAYLGMIPKAGTLNSGIFVIRANDRKIDQVFLSKIFMSFYFEEFLNRLVAGSTINHLYQKDFVKFCFPLPNSEEQTAIAAALSDVDSLISALTKKIEKKKAIKQGLMQQLLTGKKRLSGFNDKWKSMLLGDIAEVKDGTHQTPQYVKSGGKPFYSVENVTADDFKNVKHISLEEHKALTSNYRIEKGDVLMTRIGSIGCCKYVDWDVDASFYVSLALLKINEKYDSKFISYLSNIKSFKEEVMLNSLVFAIPQKINLGNISLIKVYIPTSKAEQTAIANILSDCDSEIAALEEKRDKYKEIKQGMMQQLLTGKIRLIK